MVRSGRNFFVLTGGPGAGKTTLIDALGRAGFATAAEAGRAIIRQQTPIGGRALPSVDPLLFAEMMLAFDLQAYERNAGAARPVFFDRGIVDVIGYLRLVGQPVPEHMRQAARLHRYNARAFVCPPWPEIFAQDAERKQDLQEAEQTWHALTAAYADCGYDLIDVPRSALDARLRFIVASACGA